jgi:hypothetical protein
MSSSSLDEKEKDWRMGDPQVAAQSTKEYEPIKTEPKAVGTETDLEANADKRSSRGNLSRLQSRSSGYSDISSEYVDDAKSSTIGKRKWTSKINPLKWGPKPPVPKEREVCPEYNAGFFSQLYFVWMGPLMTVG